MLYNNEIEMPITRLILLCSQMNHHMCLDLFLSCDYEDFSSLMEVIYHCIVVAILQGVEKTQCSKLQKTKHSTPRHQGRCNATRIQHVK